MVKGLSRRVIVVDSPDPHIFEQAIFIVRNDAAVGSGGVTSQQVVDQAIRIAKDYARTHGAPPRRRLRMSPWLAALLGGAAIGAVWLRAMLLPTAGFAAWPVSRYLDPRTLVLLVVGLALCGPVQALWPRLRQALYDQEETGPAQSLALLALGFVCLTLLVSGTYNPFIYFRF